MTTPRHRPVQARRARRIGVASLLAIGALLGPGAAAQAQPAIKPGLWEVQLKNAEMEAAMKQFQQQLAAMPPAQRAQFEKMMADKGGQMSADGKVRVCHTADTLKRGLMKDEPGCTTRTQWQAAGGTFETVCENGRKGRGDFVFSGDTYRGTIEATDPKAPGKVFRMEQTGRWISADCGQVKPFTPPAPPGKG